MKRSMLHGWHDVPEPRVTVWVFDASDDQRIAGLLAQDFAEIDRRQLGRFTRVELLKTAPKVEDVREWPREGFRW